MKNQKTLSVLIALVFLVVFNVLFYMSGGTDRTLSVWISYAFIHFAYIMMVVSPAFVTKGKSQAVFGLAIGSVSSAYFVIEFIVGLIFILVAPDNFMPALFVQLIMAAVYLILLMTNMKANLATAGSEAVREAEVSLIKDASGKMKLMLNGLNDAEADKAVERAYDYVRTSPTKSSPAVRQLEMDLLMKVGELGSAVSEKNAPKAKEIANNIVSIMEQRNQQL